MTFADVNLIAVVVAAVAVFIVGFLWYGKLFGETYMKVIGITKAQAKKAHGKGMGVNMLKEFILGLVTVFILAVAIGGLSFSPYKTATLLAILVATKDFAPTIWQNKPMTGFWLNAGYSLVALNIAAYVLGLF